MTSRRSFLLSIAAAAAGMTVGGPAAHAVPLVNIQRRLSLEMAKSYALNGDKRMFRKLFDVQTAFLGLSWPATPLVVTDAMSALRRVIDGDPVNRIGFRHVRRRSLEGARFVVFSDQHIVPSENRQSGVWRANRDAYTKLLEHYGGQGWVVVENGDVEDLVILEPEYTFAMYDRLMRTHARAANPRVLIEWYRDDPMSLVEALKDGRKENRQRQLEQIFADPGNRDYYQALKALASSDQLVRLAGNHDYNLQELTVGEQHLVPIDVLLLEEDRPHFALMHGHQFDQATHPGVAPLYGEVVSECLGIWYQGPDRVWSAKQGRRILEGGFPNRLSTHKGAHRGGGMPGRFLGALLSSQESDDEEWALAWESLFGHPIAWEYGARDWASAVQGHLARPGDLVEDAMIGRQFFKFRHLDEWEILRGLNLWDIDVGLALGHSHEVRCHTTGVGKSRYFNSGAAGRFEKLIWALEITEAGRVEVVGWFLDDEGSCERVLFHTRETELFSYFEPERTGERISVGEGGPS